MRPWPGSPGPHPLRLYPARFQRCRRPPRRPGAGRRRVLHLLLPDSVPLAVHASASHIELHGRSLLLVLMHVRVNRPAAVPPDQIVAEVKKWPAAAVASLIERLEP